MAETEAAKQLAARIRLAMDRHAEQVLSREHVSGVGVAWRQGTIRFVVQTDSTVYVDDLLAHLPSQVEGFPLAIEVESYPRAAVVEPIVRTPRGSLWQRLLGRSQWLGLVRKDQAVAAS